MSKCQTARVDLSRRRTALEVRMLGVAMYVSIFGKRTSFPLRHGHQRLFNAAASHEYILTQADD